MRILVAEDEEDTLRFVERGLSELGHNIIAATNGEDALHHGLTEALDVIVLDRMLPNLDGLCVLKRLRAGGVTSPVLMLTALGRIEDRVDGLQAGDDYLVKPFAFSELAARIQALGRRLAPAAVTTKLQANGIEMDLLTREVRREGKPIFLQPREFRLLEEMMRHAGAFTCLVLVRTSGRRAVLCALSPSRSLSAFSSLRSHSMILV